MTCREFVELVTEYFEKSLSEEDARSFEEHLGRCPACTRYIEQMRVTITTVGRIDVDSISAEAKDALLYEFRNWHAD